MCKESEEPACADDRQDAENVGTRAAETRRGVRPKIEPKKRQPGLSADLPSSQGYWRRPAPSAEVGGR